MSMESEVDEACIQRLELQWAAGNSQAFDWVIAESHDQISLSTLVELVTVDMEFRWKRFNNQLEIATIDSSLSISEYLTRFPLLNEDEIVERLVEEEFRIRRKYGDQPPLEWFIARAPKITERLQELDLAYPIETPAVSGRPQLATARSPESAHVEFPVVPNFKILEEIGRGGMGQVYRAEQEHPVRREVALKLIRAGSDSREFLARFDAERQALALMDHPNIAQIFQAGTSEAGIPFFAMEFVDGQTIAEYCRDNRLSVEERLHLFTDVCSAVQHAHQKGILHRDLKPSNILVDEKDTKPIVKVIDFGLAKAIDHAKELTAGTLQTFVGQVLGTLKYMSPEQANAAGDDVDTRSDVYALGVILFELLVGETPLDDSGLQEKGVFSILQKIKDMEPVRPSSKLLCEESSKSISTQLRTSSRSLRSALQGDLDWIVVRALENDRERRYASAAGLAEDVRRFLDNEPVIARPPSASYRLRKFIRKNRLMVASIAAMVLLLFGGIVATTSQMLRALSAEELASQREGEAIRLAQESEGRRILAVKAEEKERKARVESEDAKERALNVLDVVVESFRAIDPQLGASKGMLAADVLKLAAQKTKTRFKKDELGKAMMMNALSRSFAGIGEPNLAIENAESAFRIRSRLLGSGDQLTNFAMQSLAQAYFTSGKYQDAKELAEQMLETYTNSDSAHQLDIASAQNTLAVVLLKLDQKQRAEELLKDAIKTFEREPDTEPARLFSSLGNLGYLLQQTDRPKEAILVFEKLIPRIEAELGHNDPAVSGALNHLGLCFTSLGEYDRAHDYHRQSFEMAVEVLGETHPQTLNSMRGYGTSLGHLRKHSQAIDVLEKQIELSLKSLDKDDPSVLVSRNNLASVYIDDGQLEKAAAMNKLVLETRIRVLGKSHDRTLASMNNLASNYTSMGKTNLSIPLLKQALSLARKKAAARGQVELSRQTIITMYNLANASIGTTPGEAAILLEEALRLNKKQRGYQDFLTGRIVSVLGTAYFLDDRQSEMRKLFERSSNEMLKEGGAHNVRDASQLLYALATSSLEAKSPELALRYLGQLRELSRSHSTIPLGQKFRWYRDTVIALLLNQEVDQAAKTCDELITIFEKRKSKTSSDYAHICVSRATVHWLANETSQARAVAKSALNIKEILPIDQTRAKMILTMTDQSLAASEAISKAHVFYESLEKNREEHPAHFSNFEEIACRVVILFCQSRSDDEEAQRQLMQWKARLNQLQSMRESPK